MKNEGLTLNDSLQLVGRVSLGGAIGGAVSAASGRNFWQGFSVGGSTALLGELLNDMQGKNKQQQQQQDAEKNSRALEPSISDGFKVFSQCMGDMVLAPGWSTYTVGTGEAAGYAYTAHAWEHAAARGLTYPMRSSIVRFNLLLGRNLGPAAMLLSIIGAEGICLHEEIQYLNGK